MAKILIGIITFLSICINTFGSHLPEFKDFNQSLREDIVDILEVEPVIVSNISASTGLTNTYVGLFKKNGETFSFELYVWYGSQGASGAAIKNITKVPALHL
jgi:hypothetical protein